MQEVVSTLKSIILKENDMVIEEKRNNLLQKNEMDFNSSGGYIQETYWYKIKAENGDKIAQYNLGKCYEYGDDIEKDLEKAFEWYKKSAEQEYSDAQYQLGCFYEKG